MRRRWLLLIESYSGELFARNDLTAEREEALVLSLVLSDCHINGRLLFRLLFLLLLISNFDLRDV